EPHQRKPVCFVFAFDLGKETKEETKPAILEVFQADRSCDRFVPWRQGYHPKDHLAMIEAKEMRAWQERQEEKQRQWQDEQKQRDREYQEQQRKRDQEHQEEQRRRDREWQEEQRRKDQDRQEHQRTDDRTWQLE